MKDHEWKQVIGARGASPSLEGCWGVPGAAGNSPCALHVVLLALLLPPLAWLEVLEGEGVHLGAPLGQHGQELGDRGGCHWGWVL